MHVLFDTNVDHMNNDHDDDDDDNGGDDDGKIHKQYMTYSKQANEPSGPISWIL